MEPNLHPAQAQTATNNLSSPSTTNTSKTGKPRGRRAATSDDDEEVTIATFSAKKGAAKKLVFVHLRGQRPLITSEGQRLEPFFTPDQGFDVAHACYAEILGKKFDFAIFKQARPVQSTLNTYGRLTRLLVLRGIA